MSYEPQAGTIPAKALAWLRCMNRFNPGCKVPTAELCERAGLDSEGFTAYMAPLRAHGVVKAEKMGHFMVWSVGDGKHAGYEVLHSTPRLPVPPKRKPSKPMKPWDVPKFRALEWDGKVLVTGMDVHDGVAVFTREQIRALAGAMA